MYITSNYFLGKKRTVGYGRHGVKYSLMGFTNCQLQGSTLAIKQLFEKSSKTFTEQQYSIVAILRPGQLRGKAKILSEIRIS